jgi:hypothetical protein
VSRWRDCVHHPTIILVPIANYDSGQHGRDQISRLQKLQDAIEIYVAVIESYGSH